MKGARKKVGGYVHTEGEEVGGGEGGETNKEKKPTQTSEAAKQVLRRRPREGARFRREQKKERRDGSWLTGCRRRADGWGGGRTGIRVCVGGGGCENTNTDTHTHTRTRTSSAVGRQSGWEGVGKGVYGGLPEREREGGGGGGGGGRAPLTEHRGRQREAGWRGGARRGGWAVG